ncbi:MAG: DUF1846 domain-containing protein [Kiritimatiellae bacterium]|nr:DUF1846 domain-containing protein [Kiritimatiellia bacterium]
MGNQAVGFDSARYLEEQSEYILERAKSFDDRLYLEFGGKLISDHHASRVLPGFDPHAKVRLLQRLKDVTDIILCIYAGDIERKKLRADFGITYDVDVLRLLDEFASWGLHVAAVVITRYEEQPAAVQFKHGLERRGVRVYTHRATKGYPTDVDTIASEEGYGANPYIEVSRPVVVVTAPGPGSGKMATCLSQVYHDHQRGRKSGYSKFETFPIWNLPLKHPVNIAYEAATADLGDVNMVDPFHLEATGEQAINYNRDIEIFPVLRRILEKVTGAESPYQSPTQMGVNRAGFAITDDAVVREAATQEVIRRYFRYGCEHALGFASPETLERATLLMEEIGGSPEQRPVVPVAREAATRAVDAGKGKEGVYCGAALCLSDGRIVAGSNSNAMHATSSLVLNAVKTLAEIPHEMEILTENTIASITRLKRDILETRQLSLDLEETLIALSVSAISNSAAKVAMEKLTALRGCEMHLTHMPPPGDEAGLRVLGVNVTSDPHFAGKNLYIT